MIIYISDVWYRIYDMFICSLFFGMSITILCHRVAQVKLGQQEEDPRWKQCVMYTAHVFKFGLSKEFVRRAFTEEDKTNVS